MTEEIKQGMTRREVLKKGALFGGTLMWVAPVVQAVGMSPAMAQIPSEGTCCLRIFLQTPTFAANGSLFDVTLTSKVRNCGSNAISNIRSHIDMISSGLDETVDSNWTKGVAGHLVQLGELAPGAETAWDEDLVNGVSAGTYKFRMYATYDCLDASGLPQNVPSPYAFTAWVTMP